MSHAQIDRTTLIRPGDEWTNAAVERALGLSFQLVDSYYLANRGNERFSWAANVCALYLDQPDAAWFAAELPVASYCYDRDLALKGVGWFAV